MSEGAFVIKEPAKVTISIWREKVPESLKPTVKHLPKDGTMLAVREPISVNTGLVHFVPDEDATTIDTIANQKNLKPEQVLDRLARGERFELDYDHTKFPYFTAPKSVMNKYRTLSNDDPRVKQILNEAAELNRDDRRRTELVQKAKKFKRSKRFMQKLDNLPKK